MKHTLLILLLILHGCSYRTVTTKKANPKECAALYVAPALDTGLTLLGTAGVAAVPVALSGASLSNNRDVGGVFIFAGVLLAVAIASGISAHHGYTEVAKCRKNASDPLLPQK